MKNQLLAKTELFRGITADEIEKLLHCFRTERHIFHKGETVYSPGDRTQSLGIVLSGGLNVENDDFWGNKTILDHIGTGQIFAETYACIPEEPMLIGVVATERTEVLLIGVEKLLSPCETVCPYHSKVIRNLVKVAAQKNLNLTNKIFHTTAKTIRGRVLSYLSYQARRQGKSTFDIPFNRQQLSDYLEVDRSALSSELSRMQQDGLIRYQKNQFSLLGHTP